MHELTRVPPHIHPTRPDDSGRLRVTVDHEPRPVTRTTSGFDARYPVSGRSPGNDAHIPSFQRLQEEVALAKTARARALA